eukprot:scaffold188752_cov27-Tisochrysis_lutea.AAC.1
MAAHHGTAALFFVACYQMVVAKDSQIALVARAWCECLGTTCSSCRYAPCVVSPHSPLAHVPSNVPQFGSIYRPVTHAF